MKNNIRQIRQAKGMTLEQVAEAADTSFAQIQKLEKGERRLTIDWMSRIAGALGVRSQDLIAEEPPQTLRVTAYVGPGGEVHPYNDAEKHPEQRDVECPPGLSPEHVVAIRIRGDSMLPVLQPEWIVYYSDQRDIEIPIIRDGWQVPYNKPTAEPLSEFFGKLCIVRLKDGRTMLRTLKKGHAIGRYTLTSPTSADIEDAEIDWAAKIIFIKT